MNPKELIERALQLYNLAINSLENGDFIDACEKAWGAIENIRKALLVKIGISYNSAKSISIGIPIFTRLLKGVGKKDLLEKYTYFNYKLHVMGFYENVTEDWEIEEIIREELPLWIDRMCKLIDTVDINLSEAEKIVREMERLKRKLVLTHAEMSVLRSKLEETMNKHIQKMKKAGTH